MTRPPYPPAEDEPLLPEIPKCDASALDTTVVVPATWLSDTFRSILTRRPFVSEFHNFLLGLQLHSDYLQNGQFSMWKGASRHGPSCAERQPDAGAGQKMLESQEPPPLCSDPGVGADPGTAERSVTPGCSRFR